MAMEALLKLLALFLVLFFSFLFALRFYAQYRMSKMRGRKVDCIKDGIVYFYSQRCGACKLMTPQVESIKEKVQVLMVDVFSEEGSRMAKELGIMATPTTLIVKDGIILKSFVGVVSREKLLKEV